VIGVRGDSGKSGVPKRLLTMRIVARESMEPTTIAFRSTCFLLDRCR
jgi:hypothetical protein